jgi:hypothetical protein
VSPGRLRGPAHKSAEANSAGDMHGSAAPGSPVQVSTRIAYHLEVREHHGVEVAGQRWKRHHYLPVSYLAGWSDSKGAGRAVRRRDRPQSFCASTRRVAVEADLYSFRTESDVDDSLEVALSEIEQPLKGHLVELRDGRTPRRGTPMREEVSVLLVLQIARTPEHQQRWVFPASVILDRYGISWSSITF